MPADRKSEIQISKSAPRACFKIVAPEVARLTSLPRSGAFPKRFEPRHIGCHGANGLSKHVLRQEHHAVKTLDRTTGAVGLGSSAARGHHLRRQPAPGTRAEVRIVFHAVSHAAH